MTFSKPETGLTPISAAQRMLAAAETIPDLSAVHDYAAAALTWARQRGLGIDAENEAAEVIWRSERRMGQSLAAAKEAGQLPMGGGVLGSNQHVKRTAADSTEADQERVEEMNWLHRLKLTKNDSANFQLAAAVPEERFEAMLREMKMHVQRLSKVNLYRAGREARGKAQVPETSEDSGFAQFRAGVHKLIGWQVTEAGLGFTTENRLKYLPKDELAQIKELCQMLANAYSEAVHARAAR